MSATYDSTLPNDRNWVRFLVGDITPSRALLQDDEIDGVLEEEARTVTIAAALKYFAAARCIDIIHTRYATAGAHQGGVMMKRVDDLARSFGVSASTSAALDEKTRDLRKRGARLLTSSRSHFMRSLSVVMLAGLASIFGDTTPAAHAQSYFWLQFLAPVANSAALPSCADGSVYERRSIVTLAPSPGSIYQCPDGGGSWTCIVGADCPSTGTVTSVALSMPAEFSVSGSPITGTGTFSVTRATQAANRLLAGPTSGAAAVPTFRAITAADLGSGSATSSTYLRGDMTWAALSADPTLAGDVDGLGSANDLDELAVESELEAVLDLQDLQGAVMPSQLPPPFGASLGVPSVSGVLMAWYASDEPSLVESGLDGLGVYRWHDRSGNGRHATQFDPTKRPLVTLASQNSKTGLTLPAGGVMTAGPGPGTISAGSIYVVWKPGTVSANNRIITLSPFSAPGGDYTDGIAAVLVDGGAATTLRSFRTGLADALDVTGPTLGTSAALFSTRWGGGTAAQRKNNDAEATDTYTDYSFRADVIGISASPTGGDAVSGQSVWYEIIIYSTKLSDPDDLIVRTYLNTKWALW